MINNLKHIYHRWVGLSNSIFIDVSVLFCLRWCLDKIGSLGSFLRLVYLIEVSNFVAILALGILGWTFLAWLVLWLSTSHTLSFHSWGFSRWLAVSSRGLHYRFILYPIPSTGALWFVALPPVLPMVIYSKVHGRTGIELGQKLVLSVTIFNC